MNLSIKIGKTKFPNPVTVASGTFGWKEKYYRLADVKKLGAIVPKTITLHAQKGNPPPRIHETPAGMLNAIGIENAGADAFIQEKIPMYKKLKVPLIVSVSAHSEKDFIQLIEKFNGVKGLGALELNLSCPNLKKKTLVAQDPKATHRIVKAVKKRAKMPIIAKLSPNVTDITKIAEAAEDAGADGLSMINTLAGMAIDVKTRKPVLGNVTGGLSGPAVRPVALNIVYRAAQKVNIPIIAMGGIATANDALEFLIAGASMVAVGTMNFINPSAPLEVLAGIKKYMREQKIKDIQKLIGSIRT
ncbi:MAG: dihydroorotate dehydrogenase [Candidatus Omnitrophica bacterium]|nr:dihydroorotate dehydrogenase [Candidatus Omnitrophota bacterium]